MGDKRVRVNSRIGSANEAQQAFLSFEDPEQVLLVPESAEVTTFLVGEAPAVRRMVTTYGDFRRFVADVEIRPVDE